MKKAIIWIVVVAVIVVVVAVRMTRREEGPAARSIEEIQAEEGVPVDVATVRTGTITVVREITGLVSGIRQSVLRAPGDYKIAQVVVGEGQPVKRGQTLVRFDTDISPDRMARLTQVRESFDNARRQVDRLEPLYKEGAIAESELDAARTRLAIAEADLRNARLELEITSPIDGVATLIACRSGDAVEAGDVVAQVAVLDSVRIESDVSGGTVSELRSGQPVYLDGMAGGEAPAPGSLTRVALGADPDTRLFRVEATLDNNSELRPGLVVTLEVIVDRVGPVMVISESALLGDDAPAPGGQFDVWAVSDDTAARTTIEIGQSAEGLVEVRSGLDNGDQVVVFGGNRLKDGTKIRLHRVDGVAVETPVGETTATTDGEGLR
jgi:membrane fusion protein (multidrug efflux system)